MFGFIWYVPSHESIVEFSYDFLREKQLVVNDSWKNIELIYTKT